MENEKKNNVQENTASRDKIEDKKKSRVWSCCDGSHSYLYCCLRIFILAAIVVFILSVIAAFCRIGHYGGRGEYGIRKEGRNMMYFNREIGRNGSGKFGGCPMMEGNLKTSKSTTGGVGAFNSVCGGEGKCQFAGSQTDSTLTKDMIEVFTKTGAVTKIEGAKITMKDNAGEKVINTNAKTVFKNGDKEGKISDIKNEDNLSVVGLPNINGEIDAQLIRILVK